MPGEKEDFDYKSYIAGYNAKGQASKRQIAQVVETSKRMVDELQKSCEDIMNTHDADLENAVKGVMAQSTQNNDVIRAVNGIREIATKLIDSQNKVADTLKANEFALKQSEQTLDSFIKEANKILSEIKKAK